MAAMKVAAGIDQIRNNPRLYLGDQEPSGRFLAVGLAGCALTSGAEHVQIQLQLLTDGWVSVSAERDWISPSLPEKFRSRLLDQVVLSLIPQLGGRQNEIRYEVIAAAFSSSFSMKSGDTWTIALGDAPPQIVRARLAEAEFAIVFKPQVTGS